MKPDALLHEIILSLRHASNISYAIDLGDVVDVARVHEVSFASTKCANNDA